MGSTNLKILFFAFGIIICLITISFMYGIITKNKEIITDGTTSSTDCLYLDFKIEKISYQDNNINVLIRNPTSNNMEINKIYLKNNNEVYLKNQLIKIGETKSVSFWNISLTDNMFIYINNCIGFEKKVVL